MFSFHIFGMFLLAQTTEAMTSFKKDVFFFGKTEPEADIADFILSKGYLPKDKDLPKPSVVKKNENDDTYILSKLSDDDLIKLLSDQSMKTDFDLKDIIKVAMKGNPSKQNLLLPHTRHLSHQNDIETEFKNSDNRKPISTLNPSETQDAVFRLDNKEVSPELQNEAKYSAFKKLNSLLNLGTPVESKKSDLNMDDSKKEILFDILVSQLKLLCCKNPKRQELQTDNILYKSPKNIKQNHVSKYMPPASISYKTSEFMFLIINDEIKSKGSGELVSVHPESLEKNSSVLLLGPITTPLSDGQLLSIMNRISRELSKPEYATLLQQLSDGTLSDNNKKLLNNFFYNSETRRYIKPHRCNHQSRLAQIYGGPKWLICTGYININTPSLYDK